MKAAQDQSGTIEQGEPPTNAAAPTLVGAQPRRGAIQIRVRGRRIRLRGLRREPVGPLRWLLVLGPGVIAGAAANDAGSIATYSLVGATYGYSLLWALLLGTVSLAVVQEMTARLGVASGRGLLDLIRERYGLAWSVFAIVVMLAANGGLILSEFVGIGAAAELVGVDRLLAVPVAAALVWGLVVFGSYANVEKIFLVMALAFFTYPVAAVLAHPQWRDVAKGTFVPTIQSFLGRGVQRLGQSIDQFPADAAFAFFDAANGAGVGAGRRGERALRHCARLAQFRQQRTEFGMGGRLAAVSRSHGTMLPAQQGRPSAGARAMDRRL